MASKLYIAKVGGGEIELTSFTGRKGIPFFDGDTPLIQLGMRCANGEASQGTFKVTDPIAELPRADFAFNLPAHKLVWWTEDAPGAEIWLSRGRTATYEGGRGTVVLDNIVEYDVTVDDGNIDLRGQAFTEAWVRPAETEIERLFALQAYTLNGAASTAVNHRDTCDITVSDSHLCPDSNQGAMPAKTYPVGTQPQDVVSDCADTAGKVYSVVIHHTGGSHLCLLHILETDHTTYLSPISISDNLSDWDPTDPTTPTFEPHWEAGKATIYDGQELLSGLVSIYGTDQSVFAENAGNITSYDYWVDSYYDADSENAVQASNRADSLLLYRGLTTITHRVSIIMLPSQLDLVAAGMSVSIKAAAAIGGADLDTWQTRRIAECSFEPRIDGRYWAHLNLDRAQRRSRNSSGPGQPAATVPLGPAGPPIPPTDPDDPNCPADVCELVPTAWIQAPAANPFIDMEAVFTDGAIDLIAPQGVEGPVMGIVYQTAGTMFPPLVAGEGQLRGAITLPLLDSDVYGAVIRIILRTPASGSSNGQGILIVQSTGEAPSDPHDDPEVKGWAIDSNMWQAGGSSSITYLAPLSGTYKYAIRYCDSETWVKLWPAGVEEPATWEGPGNTAVPNEVRIVMTVDPREIFGPAHVPYSEDFVYHFTRPTWCTGDGQPTYYYQWTAATYIETADGATTTFFLPPDPAGGVAGLNAFVNGVYEPSTFDSVTRSFTLAYAPDEGDIVDAAWIPIP